MIIAETLERGGEKEEEEEEVERTMMVGRLRQRVEGRRVVTMAT